MDLNRKNLAPLACWFTSDAVPAQPEVTAFKRRARLHQAQWRTTRGWCNGTHGPRADIPNGSKLHPDHGAAMRNFLSDRISSAVHHRLLETSRQRGQQLDETRLKNDLLSSMPMCFNLFGDLHGRSEALALAAQALWGVTDTGPAELIFEWSPGRRQKPYTGDGTAFDAAFLLGPEDAPRHIIGVETKYHEHSVPEKVPNPQTRLPRYMEIVNASGIFKKGWEDEVLGKDLQQIWRDHLLLLSMLSPENDQWSGGRYVLAYPEKNPSFGDAGKRYFDVLKDPDTFAVMTIEELLDKHVLHDPDLESEFRSRYLW